LGRKQPEPTGAVVPTRAKSTANWSTPTWRGAPSTISASRCRRCCGARAWN